MSSWKMVSSLPTFTRKRWNVCSNRGSLIWTITSRSNGPSSGRGQNREAVSRTWSVAAHWRSSRVFISHHAWKCRVRRLVSASNDHSRRLMKDRLDVCMSRRRLCLNLVDHLFKSVTDWVPHNLSRSYQACLEARKLPSKLWRCYIKLTAMSLRWRIWKRARISVTRPRILRALIWRPITSHHSSKRKTPTRWRKAKWA